MEGTIERTILESREGGSLAGILRVVAVITDDREKDMRGSDYPLRPEADRPWLHGQDLRNDDDSLVVDPDTTHLIPSIILPSKSKILRQPLPGTRSISIARFLIKMTAGDY